jgi:hypothetical protein
VRSNPFSNGLPAVSVHRLVRAVAQSRSEVRGTSQDAKRRLGTWLSTIYPQFLVGNMTTVRSFQSSFICESLTPHVIELQKAAAPEDESWPYVLRGAGNFLAVRGRYGEAELMSRAALAAFEKKFGFERQEIVAVIRDLARLMDGQRRPRDADTFYHRGLAILGDNLATLERTLGRNHPDTACIQVALAELLLEAGRPNEACILSDTARSILKKADHSLTTHAAQLASNASDMLDRLMEKARALADAGQTTEADALKSEHLSSANVDDALSKIAGPLDRL